MPDEASATLAAKAAKAGAAASAASPALPPARSPAVSPAAGGLPPRVSGALACAGLPMDSLAVLVTPLGDAGAAAPAAVLSHQPDRPMQPASTMKVLTSVIGLDRLGPNHRGHTTVLSAAPVAGDVLQGDLVLRGGADPELGLPEVWELLQALRWQGVREIAGDVVLDRGLFSPSRPDLGVSPFDDAPEFPYNVIPDALQFTGQLMRLELRSDDAAVQARPLPPVAGVQIDATALALDDRACARWENGWTTPDVRTEADGQVTIALRGSYPRRCLQQPALQLFDRDLQAERQLRWLWTQLGGTWGGRVRDGATPIGARVLARHEARPWGELVRPLNKNSDNVLARLMYLSLGTADTDLAGSGVAAADGATSAARSESVVRRWLADHRIDATGLVVDNGSGLSRSERLTPRQLVELLRVGLAGPNAADLRMSLPSAGVDGTLRNRLKDSVAAHSARLKTGGLRNVSSLAGVVPDRQGRDWLVAALLNDEALATRGAGGRQALDTLVDWVARTGLSPAGWQEAPAACR